MNFSNDLNKSQSAKILACYGIKPEEQIEKSEEAVSESTSEESSEIEKSDDDDSDLEKAAKGLGSHGGKVIGTTKSGKPIYAHHEADSSHYKDFTNEDHDDAMIAHSEKSKKQAFAQGRDHHQMMAQGHKEIKS